MSTRNFLRATAVLLVGIIIYKLLFGFVLPIVLFVSLGSILKILLKGSADNLDTPSTEVLNEGSISLSDNDVVEVEPMQENTEVQPSDDKNPEIYKSNEPSTDIKTESNNITDASKDLNIEDNNNDVSLGDPDFKDI